VHKLLVAKAVDEKMRRRVQCQGQRRQRSEVEREVAASVTVAGQDRQQDAAYGIQKLARHEHQDHGHQSLGHVVVCPRSLGYMLTPQVELAKRDHQAVGHDGN